MSMQTLERAILVEAKQVFNNPKLRMKDIMEWSNRKAWVEGHVEANEVAAELPKMGVWAAIKKSCDKR